MLRPMIELHTRRDSPSPYLSPSRPLWMSFFVVGVVCLLFLSACGGGNTSVTPQKATAKGGNLTVGLIAEPTTLDPLKSASLYDSDIMYNIYDTLFRYNAQNQLVPDLVTSYTYTTPTSLTLNLHTGVTFQDGTPFNADAVVFNINRFLNDKASPRATDVENISSVLKASDSQVVIKLKKPFGPLLSVLANDVGMMLSPKAVQQLGATLGNGPVGVGSGPFLFSQWVKGSQLVLKANPHYWQKDKDGVQLPYLQSVTYHTITNGTVMFSNLETGQIQVGTNIDPNDLPQMKSDSSLIYRQIIGPGFTAVQFNTTVAPLNNVHVRRAIAYALNRQEIVQSVLKNVGAPATGPFSPATWAYDKSFTGYSYNIAQAKAELAQAGLSKVSLTLAITSGNPTTTQEAQYIQSELQPAGITLNIKQETFTTLVTDFQTKHYQTLLIGWTGSVDPDGVVYAMFTTHGGFDYTGYSNPQVDSLLNAARTTTDQTERAKDYQAAQKLIVQDAPCAFLTWSAVAQATSSKVKNYQLLPSAVMDFTSVYLAS
jgi:peptide/nickel transport system substrate-binding protein